MIELQKILQFREHVLGRLTKRRLWEGSDRPVLGKVVVLLAEYSLEELTLDVQNLKVAKLIQIVESRWHVYIMVTTTFTPSFGKLTPNFGKLTLCHVNTCFVIALD